MVVVVVVVGAAALRNPPPPPRDYTIVEDTHLRRLTRRKKQLTKRGQEWVGPPSG